MRPLSVLGALAVSLLPSRVAMAAPPEASAPGANFAATTRGDYAHVFTQFGYGRGLRWNNPFRLQTELGESPRSLSLTAGYVDLGLGATFGAPDGIQHGAVLHLSLAANGISQQTLSVSYLFQVPLAERGLAYARAGFPFVLSPDMGAGVEFAAGATYFVTGGVGVNAELVQSLFVGAATWEQDPSLWPITSLQLGLWFDYEVLP